MYKLFETKLQKFILLFSGLLIFLRLIDVDYYDRHNAILASIGILILTTALLIIFQNYHPKLNLGFIKKYRLLLFISIILIVLVILVLIIQRYYLNIQEQKIIKQQKQKFYLGEMAYQKCLDKIANLTMDYGKYKTVNKYFNEWEDAGRPNYNQKIGRWEWAFMEWMMEKYPEFCIEYNTELINYFLLEKEVKILELPELPSLKMNLPSLKMDLPSLSQ